MIKDWGTGIEDWGPGTEDWGPRTEDWGPRTEDRGVRIEDRGPRNEDSLRPTENTLVDLLVLKKSVGSQAACQLATVCASLLCSAQNAQSSSLDNCTFKIFQCNATQCTRWLAGRTRSWCTLICSDQHYTLSNTSSWTIIICHRMFSGAISLANWMINQIWEKHWCTYIFPCKSMKKVQGWKVYADWQMVKLLFSELQWQFFGSLGIIQNLFPFCCGLMFILNCSHKKGVNTNNHQVNTTNKTH